jgi:inositol phosphorylceramide mannosyltransferase catalytic subunit
VTISFASGQWFETAISEAYHAVLPPRTEGQEVDMLYRIMMDDRPRADPWIYFTQVRGGTWMNWDNAFFLWIGDHLILVGMGVCALVRLLYWGVKSIMRKKSKKDGYRRVYREA